MRYPSPNGELIKELRELLGLSQKEVADGAPCAVNTLRTIERSERVTHDSLNRVMEFLKQQATEKRETDRGRVADILVRLDGTVATVWFLGSHAGRPESRCRMLTRKILRPIAAGLAGSGMRVVMGKSPMLLDFAQKYQEVVMGFANSATAGTIVPLPIVLFGRHRQVSNATFCSAIRRCQQRWHSMHFRKREQVEVIRAASSHGQRLSVSCI